MFLFPAKVVGKLIIEKYYKKYYLRLTVLKRTKTLHLSVQHGLSAQYDVQRCDGFIAVSAPLNL